MCLKTKANNAFKVMNSGRYLALRMSFLLVLSACNQDQFYEKQYLDPAGKKLSSVGPASIVPDGTGAVPLDGANAIPADGPGNDGDGIGAIDPGNGGGVIDPGNGGGGSTGGGSTDPGNGGGGNTGGGIGGGALCNGTGYKQSNDQFVQNSGKEGKVDILWMIDNSGSMGDEQEALAKNFDVFISEFIQKKIDFKMAVVTSDATKKYDGKIVGNSDQLLTSTKAAENEAKFMSDFKKIVNVGVKGSGQEEGLHTSNTFLKNYGSNFLRSDAYLIIVMLSDEEDQSPKNVDEYVNYYKSFKVNPGMVKVYSIVTTEQTSFKWETIGNRYIEASKLTGGVYSNIKHDFYATLRDMGGRIVDLLDSFALSGVPFNSEFKVLVDGVEQKTGWNYDSVSRSIKFEPGSVPAEGSIVIVYYNVACTQ